MILYGSQPQRYCKSMPSIIFGKQLLDFHALYDVLFHNLHRHHGHYWKHAPSKMHETAGDTALPPCMPPLAPLLLDNAMSLDVVSVLSNMHESESCAYDPSGRFTYRTGEQSMRTAHQPQHDGLPGENGTIVDIRCRTKMLDWCSKMVDYLEIDRNIVAITAYYQDRYLTTSMGKHAQNSRTLFRIVSVTSFYIATKLRVPHKWNVSAHAFAQQLCQGAVKGEEINDMEISILFALGWNVNPPIPMEYSNGFLDLIFNNSTKSSPRRRLKLSASSQQSDDDDSVLGENFLPPSAIICDCSREDDTSFQELKDRLLELVQYQLEIALHDHRLFQVRSSVIATAAILNALEGVMNESSPSGETSLFCQKSMDMVITIVTLCNMTCERELEDIRAVLLGTVVSPREEGYEEMRNEVCRETTEPPPRSGSPTVLSSPTSTPKFWSARPKCVILL